MKEFCFLCVQDFIMSTLHVNILLYTFKDFPNVTLHYMQIEKKLYAYIFELCISVHDTSTNLLVTEKYVARGSSVPHCCFILRHTRVVAAWSL